MTLDKWKYKILDGLIMFKIEWRVFELRINVEGIDYNVPSVVNGMKCIEQWASMHSIILSKQASKFAKFCTCQLGQPLDLYHLTWHTNVPLQVWPNRKHSTYYSQEIWIAASDMTVSGNHTYILHFLHWILIQLYFSDFEWKSNK